MPDKALKTHSLAGRSETAQSEFDCLFENAPSPMIVGGFDGYLLRANRACELLTGFAADELRDKPLFNFIHPDDREAAEVIVLEMCATRGGRAVDLRMLCKDGGYKWTAWTGTPLTERQSFCLIGKDTSAAYAAIETLAERARQQELVAELGRNSLAAADMPSLMNETVTLLARTLKVEYAEIRELQPDARQFIFKAGCGWKDLPVTQAPVSADPDTVSGYMLSTDQPVILEDLHREARFHGSPLLREHGVISGIGCVVPGPERPYGILAAYSDRRHGFTEDDVHFLQSVANILAAAIERRQAEEELNRFFEPSLNAMLVGTFDGMFKRCNPALERLTGYACDELKTRTIASLIHPDDRQAFITELREMATGRVARAFEARVLCKDGSVKWTLWNATPFLDWQVFYATGQDISDRRRAEEALAERARQQQAVAELGVRGADGRRSRRTARRSHGRVSANIASPLRDVP